MKRRVLPSFVSPMFRVAKLIGRRYESSIWRAGGGGPIYLVLLGDVANGIQGRLWKSRASLYYSPQFRSTIWQRNL